MFKVLCLFLALNYLAQGAYYIGVNDYTDWYTAKQRCESGIYVKVSGGRLATWDNYETYRDAVRHASIVAGHPHGSWVGLNDLGGYGGSGGEGDWHFLDGRNCGGTCLGNDRVPPNGLDEWTVGQPDDTGAEDCAHSWVGHAIDRQGNTHGLNDNNCGAQLSYVCEFQNFDSLDTPWTGNRGKYMSDDVPVPVDIPFEGVEPESKNNYYILEFTSTKDIMFIGSILLNVALITMVCYLGSKASCKKRSSAYSKVNMYSTEDEKL
mmetsp:Transcript_44308/g.39547  ORF Transcript_44308/g.39547 Transcript_44308/m.39547 type:complete len:264 (-) Transcript_44308:410-1201(-)